MTQVNDFYAQMLESQRRAAEQRVETRAALLTGLRALGVTNIEVQYEGYGDSGNVEDVVVTPDMITLTEELRRRVEDFGWDFCLCAQPGLRKQRGRLWRTDLGARDRQDRCQPLEPLYRNQYHRT